MTDSVASIEDEPLLTEDSSRQSSPFLQEVNSSLTFRARKLLQSHDGRAVLVVFVMYFLSNFSWMYLDVPIVRLLEYAVCEEHFRSHRMENRLTSKIIDERLCKIKSIQSEVALLIGVRISLEALAGTQFLV